MVESYVHTGGKVAVLLSIYQCLSESANSDNLKALAKDLCMHIAATSPVCVSRDDVPQDLVRKETEIAKAQAEGKPRKQLKKLFMVNWINIFQILVFWSNLLLKTLIKL